jgi:hypothetical protein
VVRIVRNAGFVLTGVVFLAAALAAQLKVGDDLSLSANANVSVGYNDSYGTGGSSHGVGVGGTAAVNGYFYNPNFLSFNVNPYYNQSRSNSTFGSVTDASGVTLASSIFSGSHFPGSVNYSANFNGTGNYGIPGIANFNTNGNSQGLGVTWSALLPDLPTLTVGYQMGNSNYSLYGTDQTGNSDFRSFYANSNYSFKGFNLGGGFSKGSSNALIPGVIVGGQDQTSTTDSTNYALSVSHQLPWHGSFSSSFNRSDMNSDYLGYTFNGTIDRVGASAGFNPTQKWSFSVGADYTDNFSGSLWQAIVPGAASNGTSGTATSSLTSGTSAATDASTASGGSVNAIQQGSHAWNAMFNTTYAFAPNLQAQGTIQRRDQSYSGISYGSTLYSGGLYYQRQVMGGYLGSSLSVVDSTLDGSSQNSLGFTTTVNYNRQIHGWQVGGYFNYAQNVQTILVTYMNSYYNFSGNLSRRLGRIYWTASGSGSRVGLSAVAGSSSSGQSFSTSLGTSRIALAANYSQSNGNSLAGGSGLLPTPIPPIIPPSLLVLYGGTSYGASLSGSPVRHMTASASWVRASSNLNNAGNASWNHFDSQNVYAQYQFRQIGLNGGYTRLVQGFSASGTAPASFSSFYIGVYRWFNIF